ncbi:hypothetical protein R1flu_003734 [Riccia fluitans]|uniref:Uncharacterized protein n=1 Tax=Riccia fluitans TaxID=41844 RepID=A0ABD1YAU0_9MARC
MENLHAGQKVNALRVLSAKCLRTLQLEGGLISESFEKISCFGFSSLIFHSARHLDPDVLMCKVLFEEHRIEVNRFQTISKQFIIRA